MGDGELPRESRISREEVQAMADEAVLSAWFTEYVESAAELKAFIAAFQFAGTATDDWLRRAGGRLGYLSITCRRIEHRMLELGFTPPYSPLDPRSKEVRRLRVELDRVTRALKRAEAADA